MHPAAILIVEHDPATADMLARRLDDQFRSVRMVRSLNELASALHGQHVDAVVADLELVAMDEIAEISRKLHLPVICTHRVPDEQMWTAALEAGALDVCASSDVSGIISSLYRNVEAARPNAA
jgi:DNA-binding NtrC family response regulator